MSPATAKAVYVYCEGIAAFTLTLYSADIPAMQTAISSGSWYSPPNAPNDHIDMSKVVRYTIVG